VGIAQREAPVPVGEVNGSHGIYRPGGSALNSGQVAGFRAAEYISHKYNKKDLKESSAAAEAKKELRRLLGMDRKRKGLETEMAGRAGRIPGEDDKGRRAYPQRGRAVEGAFGSEGAVCAPVAEGSGCRTLKDAAESLRKPSVVLCACRVS